MPLPKAVKIAGIQYKIAETENLTYEKAKIDSDNPGTKLWGSCSAGHQEIQVEQSLTLDAKKMTLVHEVIHAMLNHTTYAQNSEQEMICMALETPLYNLIRDNPKLIAYIQEKK